MTWGGRNGKFGWENRATDKQDTNSEWTKGSFLLIYFWIYEE
jgi:hypothetical protein